MGDWRYMPHSGDGKSVKNKLIGVPEKGRNAGIALREELNRDDTEEVLDILNGRGKTAAKTGEGFMEVWNDVQEYDFIELKDDGRLFPRPFFTELEISNKVMSSYIKNPMEEGFDRFYQGFDQFIEENYERDQINGDFEDLVTDAAERNSYKIRETYGDTVNWGVMNTNLEFTPETVLIPEEFQEIGKAVAENYWDDNPEYTTFSEYSSKQDIESVEEEEMLAETPEEVAGSYMFVSGDTAKDAGLKCEAIPGFESQLGKFQNQYKNSVENRS